MKIKMIGAVLAGATLLNATLMGFTFFKSFESTKVDMIKLEQVLHFIIHKIGQKPHVGKTVLYKLLYFCDFNYFELFEKPLTGEKYRKINHGPAPFHFNAIIKELKKKEKIVEKKVRYFNHTQIKFVSLTEPDVTSLSDNELKVVEDTLNGIGDLNAHEISDLSHEDIPWKATENKDVIDYRLVFYRDELTSFRQLSKQ